MIDGVGLFIYDQSKGGSTIRFDNAGTEFADKSDVQKEKYICKQTKYYMIRVWLF